MAAGGRLGKGREGSGSGRMCARFPREKGGDDGSGGCFPSFQFSLIGGIEG
jgi:hypothetical protein